MTTLTKAQAKKLSILKWKYIVANHGSSSGLIDKYPELDNFDFDCAYCEKYLNDDNMEYACAKCPINPPKEDYNDPEDYGCAQRKSQFYKWNKSRTVAAAQAVLDLIKNS